MNKMMINNLGMTKEGKDGFSWTMFFFGLFPPLFRGDFKKTLTMLVLGIITCGISHIGFCFIYNKLYMENLIKKGYRPVDIHYVKYLRRKGIAVPHFSL
ncbi:hypothetical protein RJG79_04485 [Mycoplasmatota bacterium WC44]